MAEPSLGSIARGAGWSWGGFKSQLLCGVRNELAIGILPMPSLFKGEEEGVLQTRQPLGLEAEPRNRGLPITGSQSPGPNQTKQTNKTSRELQNCDHSNLEVRKNCQKHQPFTQ